MNAYIGQYQKWYDVNDLRRNDKQNKPTIKAKGEKEANHTMP